MRALVLMTAALPTTGHRDLAVFAAGIGEVDVLLCARTDEPISAAQRAAALQEAVGEGVRIHTYVNDAAPDQPEDFDGDFWAWWAGEIRHRLPGMQWDYLIASEEYGAPLAAALGIRFLPYDLTRAVNPARGREVRHDIAGQWDRILPYTRRQLQFSAVFFGQESVGKTTVSRLVAAELDATWVPEYARGYLEQPGTGVEPIGMAEIWAGQQALQELVLGQAERPSVCFDTDLYSTIGYHRILGTEPPQQNPPLADIYYLLGDDIPFEPDPIRLGGDRRESEMGLWVQVLEDAGARWVHVPRGDAAEKAAWVAEDIRRRRAAKWAKVVALHRA